MVGISVKTASAIGVVAAALGLSGCGTSEQQSPTAVTSSSVAASSAQQHNDADVAFAESMIPHHQQAIEMSDVILAKQGIDARVLDLATQIKAAQSPEIDQLQSWLDQWGVTSSSDSMGPSGGMDMPGHTMPEGDMSMGEHGMMSDQAMGALEAAQGEEASRLFLTQMIEHHQGAITMSQNEIDGGQFPAAVQMARTIVATQQDEITTMQDILDTM